MRGDRSWTPGIHEAAKMSSILGLPTKGSDITILITRVHLHPLCVLVEFWGNFCQERTAEYQSLVKEVQSPGNLFQEFEGNHGDQCLVQIDGTWYRCRIVSRNGNKYSVFLIDKGMTYGTSTSNLAWGKKKHFHLPPEVEYCVLANVLPLSPESRWSPVALEFLRSLGGKRVKAHVQEVLVAHRTFVLHIPCIAKQMYEMGLARKLSPDGFQNFVLTSLQFLRKEQVSLETEQISVGTGEQLHKQDLFMYPELPTGTVEAVIVTDVTNPHRIFCQLKVFSKELKKLSEQITSCCEGRMTNCFVSPEMIGFPCAARGGEGRWYRSVVQQVFPSSKVVEVLNVDYGTKQFVQVQNVRPLAAEFFRMPVVTYVCSLYGITDKGVGWTSNQIDYLRSLLLYKTLIAKFEYQSISEGVHYVTLYGDENINLNELFGSKESCLLECGKTLGDYAIKSTAHSCKHPAQRERNPTKLTVEELSLGSSHAAVVQHVSDPSEFWIQTQSYANELDGLMDSIYHLYKDPVHKDVVRNPSVGLYCAAKAEDGDFYRATVTEVKETKIKVFFVDYGNTEVVDKSNIRTLPDEFQMLPCLALKCRLAGIRPKDGGWSRSACEFFITAVTGKTLNVHVAAKYDEGYAIHLTGPKEEGENDVGTLMCRSGHAEWAETKTSAKTSTQPAILAPPQFPNARVSHASRYDETCFHALNIASAASNETRIPTFKEHMFPIGSILDVNVSFIKSPNDFWCQLVQNTGHLKLLMHNMQAHYANSEYQPVFETACVARHPDNGMWYRALVIHRHETPHVNVLFVDYGQTEMISLYDLRRICPEFLGLRGQAFRCSLLNPVDPTSATNEWNADAVAKFHSFVETAASNLVILKCTVYAVMYSEQKIVFNIVDLETPFESVSASMVKVVKNAPTKKSAGPSFRLDTYYYSTHNVKIGTEEQVTVTCVDNVCQFYCQLERNADVIKDLKIKVNNLCHRLENIKIPPVFGTLCYAKYTDGQWYRGLIKATKPAILVHFVDYGDTIEVEKSDLLPVPKEANDIMSVPVQSVVCRLSDVPVDVPSEVNSWFETNVIEGKFRALVVAREPDGKLLVELYHGKTQINSKLKKTFQIEMCIEERVVNQGWRALDSSADHSQKTPKTVPKQDADIKDHTQTNVTRESTPTPLRQVGENGKKVKLAPLQLYRTPHQRQSCGRTPDNTGSCSEAVGPSNKQNKALPTETKQLIKSNLPGTECQVKIDVEKFPKLSELPSKSITSGMIADVYVSHCNGPLSFYVQFVREEAEIFSLVDKLNDPQALLQTDGIKDVHPGDLVQAEFADDSSWYRAVVREIHDNMTAFVEFVDFGNTATMPISKMCRLDKYFLQLPTYSTHCMLSDVAALGKEEALDPKVMSAFKEDISYNGEKVLKCHFIKQSGSMWEVTLEDRGVNVTCKMSPKCSSDGFEIASEKIEQNEEKPAETTDIRQVPENSQKSRPNSCTLRYHNQEFLEGQKLEVYITTINDDQTFWCQPVDSEDLEKITSSVSEVWQAADQKSIEPGSFSPGSPCVALFSEDNCWYRAEVIKIDGDELSVLFVDYGNTSKVSVTDTREISANLMETPPLAFLCELEGFDVSHGCWDSGAVDELSALTTDKVLQVTVSRTSREERKMKCFVQMECEGQVINEALETCRNRSMSENKPGAVEPSPVSETLLKCDSIMEESPPPGDQLENPTSQEKDTTIACFGSHGGQNAPELVYSQTADEIPKLSGAVNHCQSSGDYLHPESSAAFLEKEKDQILSECIMTTRPETPRMSENPRESDGDGNISTVVCQAIPEDILPSDIDEMFPPLDNEDDGGILSLSCEKRAETDVGTEKGGTSVMETTGPDALNSPSDENCPEAVDESESDLKSLSGEVNTCQESSFESANIPEANEQRDEGVVTNVRENSVSSTTVKMISREALGPSLIKSSQDMKQIQAESVTFSCVFPAFDASTEQEIEAGVSKEEVHCVATHVKNEEETSTQHEDTRSDPNEPSEGSNVTSIRVDRPSINTAEEMLQNESLPPCRELPNDQLIALPPDSEPQVHTVPSPDLSEQVEEGSCLTDVCSDPQQEDEIERSEELVPTPCEQTEDVSDSVQEGVSSCTEDSFASQLTKITHLCLIINDGPADVLDVEHPPEE